MAAQLGLWLYEIGSLNVKNWFHKDYKPVVYAVNNYNAAKGNGCPVIDWWNTLVLIGHNGVSSNLNELSYLFVLINIFLQAAQASFFSEVLILFLIKPKYDARFFWIYLNRNDFLKSSYFFFKNLGLRWEIVRVVCEKFWWKHMNSRKIWFHILT